MHAPRSAREGHAERARRSRSAAAARSRPRAPAPSASWCASARVRAVAVGADLEMRRRARRPRASRFVSTARGAGPSAAVPPRRRRLLARLLALGRGLALLLRARLLALVRARVGGARAAGGGGGRRQSARRGRRRRRRRRARGRSPSRCSSKTNSFICRARRPLLQPLRACGLGLSGLRLARLRAPASPPRVLHAARTAPCGLALLALVPRLELFGARLGRRRRRVVVRVLGHAREFGPMQTRVDDARGRGLGLGVAVVAARVAVLSRGRGRPRRLVCSLSRRRVRAGGRVRKSEREQRRARETSGRLVAKKPKARVRAAARCGR